VFWFKQQITGQDKILARTLKNFTDSTWTIKANIAHPETRWKPNRKLRENRALARAEGSGSLCNTGRERERERETLREP